VIIIEIFILVLYITQLEIPLFQKNTIIVLVGDVLMMILIIREFKLTNDTEIKEKGIEKIIKEFLNKRNMSIIEINTFIYI